MTSGDPLPPHLEQIGRQLTTAAHQLNTSAKRRRQPTIRLSAMAGWAVVVLATAVLLLTLPSSDGRLPGGHISPLAHPTAAQVLHRAAYVALQTTSTTPAGNQFVYAKTENGNGQIGQSWLSADGTGSSLIYQPGSTVPEKVPGCVNGHSSQRTFGEHGRPLKDFIPKSFLDKHRHQPVTMSIVANRFFGGKIPMDGPIVTTRCTAQPAFLPHLPTTVSKLLPYLVKTHVVYPAGLIPPANDLNDLAKNVSYMLDTDYLLPAQQAALYNLLAQTPGITVKTGVTDLAGRAGVGIVWSFEGTRSMLIFDPQTYTYLGTTTSVTNGNANGSALLATGIVDRAGELPSTRP